MTDRETTSITQDIINKAIENRAQPFRTISYLNEFIYYIRLAKATKLIINALKQAAKNLFKEYCRDVIAGISDVTKLLAYWQLLDIIAFYESDFKTIQSMVDDYDEYLGNFGNFIGALFGEEREL